MNDVEAQRAIESLRKGIPPDGYVRHFTVGRTHEIDDLEKRLTSGASGALLLKANYGSGKTHLLRFIKETALERGYAVSLITLDATSAVRFNRMDQILGNVVRCMEVPGRTPRGPASLFQAVLDAMTSPCPDPTRRRHLSELSSDNSWDHSSTLQSPALYVALRAWIVGSRNGDDVADIPQEVEAWLCEPWNYYVRRKWLYQRFVGGLRRYFRDPRAEWQFYNTDTGMFIFRVADYRQSWDALADLHTLAKLAGLTGLVILVDEFEDVIYGLRNVGYQQQAFWNLFRLSGGGLPGPSFYAVTPSFVDKCKNVLLGKGVRDYDFSRFERLPTFEMSPLGTSELESLAMKILETHGIAYGWEPDAVMRAAQLLGIVRKAAALQVQDRARHVIIRVVTALDELLQTQESL